MMPGPNRLVFSGLEAIALETAGRILAIAEDAVKERNTFRLVLSGGSTPKRLYEVLAASFRTRLPWHRVHFFWGDERCVDPHHPDSNYRLAREAFLEKLDIPGDNIHRMHGEASEPDAAARGYEEEIRRHFGLRLEDPPPCFDLVLLGMGADGHTASLFPGTRGLRETTRWVTANPGPRETTRLTLTPVILNQAAWVIFMVAGADKARMLAEVLDGPFEPERRPAQCIRPASGRLLWLVDEAAAAGRVTTP
ncbi:MAG: 6-phosphogluconolactonase [Nitrospirota bacterium]